MVEKETRKGENMGEAGHKIGNGEEGEEGGGIEEGGRKLPQWGYRGRGCGRAGWQPRRAAGSLRNLVC